jgi:hypothetical protein
MAWYGNRTNRGFTAPAYLRGRVRLEADAIRRHLQANQPVSPEKALMIYVMQHSIDEWDSRFGLGIAREGEW